MQDQNQSKPETASVTPQPLNEFHADAPNKAASCLERAKLTQEWLNDQEQISEVVLHRLLTSSTKAEEGRIGITYVLGQWLLSKRTGTWSDLAHGEATENSIGLRFNDGNKEMLPLEDWVFDLLGEPQIKAERFLAFLNFSAKQGTH